MMNLVQHFMRLKGVEPHEASILKDEFLDAVGEQLRDNNLDEACHICDENCIELNDIIVQL